MIWSSATILASNWKPSWANMLMPWQVTSKIALEVLLMWSKPLPSLISFCCQWQWQFPGIRWEWSYNSCQPFLSKGWRQEEEVALPVVTGQVFSIWKTLSSTIWNPKHHLLLVISVKKQRYFFTPPCSKRSCSWLKMGFHYHAAMPGLKEEEAWLTLHNNIPQPS